MGAKLLVIGIDALDANQVKKYLHRLPNIRGIQANSPEFRLKSVFPPDSDTAWATIFTGANPARHGVVHFLDPIEKSNQLQSIERENTAVRGRTFWDIASLAGKRVCVLLPHMCYPVWTVNGVMVSRSSIKDDISYYPTNLIGKYDLSSLNVVKGFPEKKRLRAYIDKNAELLRSHGDIARSLMASEDWDLFFIYSSVLDMIQHYFWNYCDESDPTYVGPNPYSDTIGLFYQLHDELIGQLASLAGPDATTILVSDHGHGMRPNEILNLNQYLHHAGLLRLKDNPVSKKISLNVDKTKNFMLKLVDRFGLGNIASKILRIFPRVRRLYTNPVSVDWEKTAAYATNLSGVKAYSYGGIILNNALPVPESRRVREKIIHDLQEQIHPRTGERVVNWISPREELYSGPYISSYPDIVFELNEGLGAGLTMDGGLFGKANTHNLVPGTHLINSAFFSIKNPRKKITRTDLELVDIAPTIYEYLQLDTTGLEGRSIHYEK